MPKPEEIWHPTWDETINRWTVNFTVQGNRIRRRLRVLREKEKRLAYDEAEQLYTDAWAAALVQSTQTNDAKTEHFLVAAKRYIEKGREARFVQRIIDAIIDDAKIPTDITIDQIDEAVFDRLHKTLYPNVTEGTVHRQLITPMRAVIRMSRDGWENVRVRGGDVARTRWLTPEEAEDLLAASDDPSVVSCWDPLRRTRQKIAFMLGSGAGPGEMLGVQAEQFNHLTREVWIEKAKTDHRPRWVQVPERPWAMMGELPANGPSFLSPNGKTYVARQNGGGQFKAAFDTVRKAAGLGDDVTPYVLRHTWATWFLCQVRSDVLLRRRGGWANKRMPDRYVKLAPADLDGRLKAHGWDFDVKIEVEAKFGSLARS